MDPAGAWDSSAKRTVMRKATLTNVWISRKNITLFRSGKSRSRARYERMEGRAGAGARKNAARIATATATLKNASHSQKNTISYRKRSWSALKNSATSRAPAGVGERRAKHIARMARTWMNAWHLRLKTDS